MTVRPETLTTRLLWAITTLLVIGLLSLATTALPGRAKPLFLLPLAFGGICAGLAVALRRSLSLRPTVVLWLYTLALALGGYGQVVLSAFRQYQHEAAARAEQDGKAAIAIQMLQQSSSDNRELAQQLQQELDQRSQGWAGFLERRFAAINITGRSATIAFLAELLLVAGGVMLMLRFLDARRTDCQAGDIATPSNSTP